MTASRPPRNLPFDAQFLCATLPLCLLLATGQAVAGYANGDTRGANLLGAVPNVVSVDPTAGSAGMAYPLEVPPGRAGLQPDLVLSYSSGASEPGPLGRGWRLLLPSIRRSTRFGQPWFDWVSGEWMGAMTRGKIKVDHPVVR